MTLLSGFKIQTKALRVSAGFSEVEGRWRRNRGVLLHIRKNAIRNFSWDTKNYPIGKLTRWSIACTYQTGQVEMNRKKRPLTEERRWKYTRWKTDEDIEKMVERLTKDGEKKATDRNRTGAMKEQGVVNTYAWKGWN